MMKLMNLVNIEVVISQTVRKKPLVYEKDEDLEELVKKNR